MKLFRCLLAVCVLCGLASVVPASAAARGHLDLGFGDGGIVDLAVRPGHESFAQLERVRVGPEGEVYFLEEATSCSSPPCSTQVYLRRYTAAGRPDMTFGGGRVGVGTAIRDGYGRAAALAVDEMGRPVVAFISEGLVTVTRFAANGIPDSSFGIAGATSVRCNCNLDSIEAGPGGLLVLGHSNLERLEGVWGALSFWARLDENGSLDPGFGQAGVAWRTMDGLEPPEAKLTRGGDAILYGFLCCVSWSKPYVQRLTSEGALRRRFGAATKRALAGLRSEWKPQIFNHLAALPRSRGRVDVLGEANEHGVLVRVRRDGSRDPRWGRRPPWGPRFQFLDATADGFGGTFVVGSFHRKGRGYEVIRLRPDGHFDHRFGGVKLPGAYDEEGLEIFARGRGKALVFSAGRSFCRGACVPQPKLYGVAGARR